MGIGDHREAFKYVCVYVCAGDSAVLGMSREGNNYRSIAHSGWEHSGCLALGYANALSTAGHVGYLDHANGAV